MNKAELRNQIVEALDATLAAVVNAQRSSQDAATHEESRAESDKDMRSTEMSYIARGQAIRVGAIETERARVAAMPIMPFAGDASIAVSALVTIADENGERRVFVAPGGGGQRLVSEGFAIDVVTPSSPLGQALIGAQVGDELVIERGGREEEISVIAIA